MCVTEMEQGRKTKICPDNKQSSQSSVVKQCVKVEKSDDNRLSSGRYFTIAHLYLAPASLARQHADVEGIESDRSKREQKLVKD